MKIRYTARAGKGAEGLVVDVEEWFAREMIKHQAAVEYQGERDAVIAQLREMMARYDKLTHEEKAELDSHPVTGLLPEIYASLRSAKQSA